MANPSYTYSLTNGTTADASQVMQNFNDILNGVTDGTKDLSISALTVAGTATLNGAINLGNASGDDITVTGSLASTIPIKTDNTYDLGAPTLRLNQIHAFESYGKQVATANTAGYKGETLSVYRARASATALTSGATLNITTTGGAFLPVTAGEWDIRAYFAIIPAATTIVQNGNLGVSLTSATLPGTGLFGYPLGNTGEFRLENYYSNVTGSGAELVQFAPTYRFSTASTVNLYLVANISFTISTATIYGYLEARRVA